MIKNVIFDLDGTLLDTSEGIIESVQHTVKQMKLNDLSEQELRSFIGPPLRDSFINICGCSDEDAQKATMIFRSHYQEGAVFHARLYDGIEELCRELNDNGIKIGVATNKPERFAVALIRKFGLNKYIYPVCGTDEGGKLSKTDLIGLCMEKIGCTVENTILVGDTENDAVGAKKAGVMFVAVTYGFGYSTVDDTSQYPCIGVIDSPQKLMKIIVEAND